MTQDLRRLVAAAAFAGAALFAAGCDQGKDDHAGHDHSKGGHDEAGQGKDGGGAKVAHAEIKDKDGKVLGQVTFTEVEGGVKVEATVQGVAPGKHGFHIHEAGECSAPDFKSAKGHFNPDKKKHGGPTSEERHAGDLGNIEVVADGSGKFELTLKGLTVADGDHSVVGKGLILHAGEDDLTTDPTGNAGDRLGCGEIAKK